MDLENPIQEYRPLNENLKSVDLGFWSINGEYVEDIQKIDISKEVGNE